MKTLPGNMKFRDSLASHNFKVFNCISIFLQSCMLTDPSDKNPLIESKSLFLSASRGGAKPKRKALHENDIDNSFPVSLKQFIRSPYVPW